MEKVAQAEKVEVTRVSTYRPGQGAEALLMRVLENKWTGCVELHFSQGTLSVVKWREHEK